MTDRPTDAAGSTIAPHPDIRIGTLAQGAAGAAYLEQIIPHGFESFSLTFWQRVPEGFDLARCAEEVKEVCQRLGGEHPPIISSLGVFGNPLQDDTNVQSWAQCINACERFGCDIVAGFAGAVQGKSMDQSMPRYKEVFGELAKRAADRGVRLAFENCDMGGDWHRPTTNIAHSPNAWEMMFHELPAENIGLQWEPCHQMVSLVDPIANLRDWAHKVFHVHGKDATVNWDIIRRYGVRSGKPCVQHRTPGFGDTNWADVISILRQAGFQGSIDIEGWHDPVYRGELEMTGQVFGCQYLKRCRGGAFVPNPQKTPA